MVAHDAGRVNGIPVHQEKSNKNSSIDHQTRPHVPIDSIIGCFALMLFGLLLRPRSNAPIRKKVKKNVASSGPKPRPIGPWPRTSTSSEPSRIVGRLYPDRTRHGFSARAVTDRS